MEGLKTGLTAKNEYTLTARRSCGDINEFRISSYYRPHTEYDGKVMFSVCLFTGGGGGAQGSPRGTPLYRFGQKMDKVLDKRWTKFWTLNGHNFGQKIWQKIWQWFWKLFQVEGHGRYASCGHAGGLSSILGVDYNLMNMQGTNSCDFLWNSQMIMIFFNQFNLKSLCLIFE